MSKKVFKMSTWKILELFGVDSICIKIQMAQNKS